MDQEYYFFVTNLINYVKNRCKNLYLHGNRVSSCILTNALSWVLRKKKDVKLNFTCINNTNHYPKIHSNKYIYVFFRFSLIFIFDNDI